MLYQSGERKDTCAAQDSVHAHAQHLVLTSARPSTWPTTLPSRGTARGEPAACCRQANQPLVADRRTSRLLQTGEPAACCRQELVCSCSVVRMDAQPLHGRAAQIARAVHGQEGCFGPPEAWPWSGSISPRAPLPEAWPWSGPRWCAACPEISTLA